MKKHFTPINFPRLPSRPHPTPEDHRTYWEGYTTGWNDASLERFRVGYIAGWTDCEAGRPYDPSDANASQTLRDIGDDSDTEDWLC